MTEARKDELKQRAIAVREHIVRMSTDGGCFIGASLSCTDIIVYLYSEVLKNDRDNLSESARDYFLLSKGHDVPALYGTLAELGFIEPSRLRNHLRTTDFIYWHPNRNVPGVEFHSGSLGHLLSVSIGLAYDIKQCGTANRVFVLLGDGELNEGSVWEACLVASSMKLDNLIAIVDRNEFQANVRTEELVPLEPLGAKFEAFGWSTDRVDGHDFQSLEGAFVNRSVAPGKPHAIIAETVRGKGLPSIERRAERWFADFTHDDIDKLLHELHGSPSARLNSEVLIVR